MTWNIHAGIGLDGRYDLSRVVALAGRHAPDIVALQEVEARGHTDRVHPFGLLREALGSQALEARTIVAEDGYYGHMLVSRWPILDSALHDLRFPGREPRCAISATVATPAGPLRVISAHFGLGLRERHWQATRLAALARGTHDPLAVMGDFNEWAWRGAVHRAFAPVLPVRTRHCTFPARSPFLALDRIYCRPRELLVRSWTDPTARKASDHLPVVAELALPPDRWDEGRPSDHREFPQAARPATVEGRMKAGQPTQTASSHTIRRAKAMPTGQ
jgi:endonuclease/exonuclease/phosphatase family metal-dependent hydrolase